MKSLAQKLEVLKKILCQTYYGKENSEVGERWHQDVMRRIRTLGPIQSGPDFFMFFEQFVWRLTPATCLLIIVGSIIFLKFDFFSDYDLFTLFISNTEELSLAQLF